MTRNDDWEEMTTGQMLQKARQSFVKFHATLTEKVDAFGWALCEKERADRASREAAEAASGEDKGKAERLERLKLLMAEIAALQKALDNIMDCERKLERIIAERAGKRSGDVDLDAARKEVLGELARLAGRG